MTAEPGTRSSAPGVAIALLNGFHLMGADRPSLPTSGQRLLALLALRGPLERSTAAGMLWPECTESRAVHSLRSTIWRLHDSLDGVLTATRREVGLAPGVRVDTQTLDERSRRLRAGCPPGEAADVLDLGTGELLPGWTEEWVVVERERIRQLQLFTLVTLAQAFAGVGDLDRAVLTAHQTLHLDPLRESSHRMLVELHLAAGNYAEALRRHDVFRDSLSAELGVQPSPQMAALVRRIPRYAPAADRPHRARPE